MNVALSELPDFSAMPGTALQPHHQSRIPVGPSLQYFEQAYFDAKSKQYNPGWARKPIVELVISSTLDDTLAPAGQHVASLFCQQVNPQVDGGWDAHRDTVARLMIETVNDYAELRAQRDRLRSIEPAGPGAPHRPGRRRHLPRRAGAGPDVQRVRSSARATTAAPSPACTCGSGSHPGGGVTNLPGRNAAREILRDLRRRPRRTECVEKLHPRVVLQQRANP